MTRQLLQTLRGCKLRSRRALASVALAELKQVVALTSAPAGPGAPAAAQARTATPRGRAGRDPEVRPTCYETAEDGATGQSPANPREQKTMQPSGESKSRVDGENQAP